VATGQEATVQDPWWKAMIEAIIAALSGRHWWAVLLAIGLVLGLPLLLVWLIHISSPPDIWLRFRMLWIRYERGKSDSKSDEPKESKPRKRRWRPWRRREP
jgi:hypothetical protein